MTRIRHHTEETSCTWCGSPLYVGDLVQWRGDEPYCAYNCCSADIDYEGAILDEQESDESWWT